MAIAVRLQHDTPVYRVWTDGTDRPSARIGAWWAFDPPAGTNKDFRERYAVCEAWNSRLSRLAACTLSRGSIVVIGPGQSVDVPTGAPHRISNEHGEDLVIIEVQHGAYTGEDDICRLEDDYGRVEVG